MELKTTHMRLALVLVITFARVGVAAPDLALPGCIDTCGNVSIPYPFGVGRSSITGKNCSMEKSFRVTCNNSMLYTGNVPVVSINLQGQLDLSFFVSWLCHNGSYRNSSLKTPAFTISSKENKFISVGCDTFGFLNSFHNGTKYTTGCLTRCNSFPDMPRMLTDGHCSGIGCCQVDIPLGIKNITLQTLSFGKFRNSLGFSNCGYSFIAKQGSYNFSLTHLKNLPYKNLPLVVDWAVGKETCEVSRSRPNYACRNNSECENTDTGYGYRCRCKTGYEGNPYHPDGCQDIDECKTSNHTCISDHNCRNTEGSHECFCLDGKSGNGTMEGGCQQNNVLSKVIIGIGAGVLVLLVGMSWLYILYQKRKLIKLKEKFFLQNGGFILQKQLSAREDSSQTAQIFTAKELKKATNNYEESLIVGKGGYGTVFKGFLPDNRLVAVKKSKVVDQSQVEQFINEVVVLSQINHRNVVKLLGCCLETEVPLLVYEFVKNGTLFDYLHNEGKETIVSWETRLRIAREAAEALSYLHSAASIPIIHRDVKSANILLDDTYTAKVSDFGASRLIPIDQTELATLVQGTLGYLDPEYMQTSKLTEKSDVYSFGVVLVELLTGEKALSFERPEEKRSLAMHFISCLKEDRLYEVLQVGILNEENKEEIKEVAVLATKCLRLKGEKRPNMKEVAIELEGIKLREKHQWANTDLNLEKTGCLLHDASGNYEHGDSSSLGNTGYDSMGGHVPTVFDDGR